MVNRILIRIKVLQIVYAYYQNGNGNLQSAENDLQFSLKKSYELYLSFLLLLIEVTHLQSQIIETKKEKYIPTQEELNPNMRFVNNRVIAQLAADKGFWQLIKENGISWDNDEDFVKRVLELILSSDLYAEYLEAEEDSYEHDLQFWAKAFKQLICDNEMIEEHLEDKSIFWNDDVEIIESFVLKTIKRFKETQPATSALQPMFKGEEDRTFAIKLLRQTFLKKEEYRELIGRYLTNWEADRIAHIDMVILQIALAEIFAFPTIHTSISMNEYIEIAKYYSSPKKVPFINAILEAIIRDAKRDHKLLKE
ncbi:MAG: transcription antitermination protein NusB [Parabacteroides sp.]|nr:transcription antitermination protein NusB [Parabacteroides sp.]MCI7007564.1 transcription antitermination protein NusB [Parabacteroides sp.]MCI7781624.1 transcription antitermination protein NusB [Parabacteroides sp.]MDD7062026.1 transcription antitermination protein NusB [bacterium]MDY4756570.1 transcription antitermination protein NusB [Parabacteroides sp.]